MSEDWFVGADIGGTFTDIVAVSTGGELRHLKVPSSREDPASGVIRGLETLEDEAGVACDRLRLVVHGTTLVTNTLIERKGAKVVAVVTTGMQDVLQIRRETRYDLYDLDLVLPPPLVPLERCLEIDLSEWRD